MTVEDADAEDRYIVPGLRRGLAILRMFSRDRRVIAVPEMVRELKISRASAFRLAYTLEAEGYLQRAPHSNSFQLGLSVLSLGFEYLGSLDLIDIARPILEDLRDRIDASTHLGVRDGLHVVYVQKAPSRHRLRNNLTVGTRMPAHATSIGRALLFDISRSDLKAIYRGAKMERFSPETPGTPEELYRRLEAESLKGYVAYRSEFAQGIASVAAPVRDAAGRIVAAINVSDHETLPAMADLDGHLKTVVLRAALAISRGLGYAAPG